MKEVVGKAAVPLSPAVKTEEYVFVSGQVPTQPDGTGQGDIKEQTALCLDKIKELLEKSGTSMKQVVKTTVFITDVQDFQAMNEAYSRYFPEDPPARSCVRADLVIDAQVEIEAIALR